MLENGMILFHFQIVPALCNQGQTLRRFQGCKLQSDIGQCPTKFGKCQDKTKFWSDIMSVQIKYIETDEKSLLHYVERETPLFDKESRPISFHNSIDWMNFNSCLTESVFWHWCRLVNWGEPSVTKELNNL